MTDQIRKASTNLALANLYIIRMNLLLLQELPVLSVK